MSLLDDLRSLDLTAVVDAKLDISVTLGEADLLALVGEGAATSILGELGTAIQAAVDGFGDPAALVDPITVALTELLGRLEIDVPIDDYVEAVNTAAGLVAALLGTLSGDPARVGFGGGLDVGRALDLAAKPFGDHAAVFSGDLARFRALVASVEHGLPSDPAALVPPALEILLPFPTTAIDEVRAWSLAISAGLDRVTVDPRVTEGLVAALVTVRAAADAGDAVALAAAFQTLEEVRAHTVRQLAAALRTVAGSVSGLRIGAGADVVHDLRDVLGSADETVFELLDGWRDMIAMVRSTIEGIDPAVAVAYFDELLDEVESAARDVLLAGVDGSVDTAKQWLRDLLREIPVRRLRMQLGEAISGAAAAIGDADLDAPVQALRATLTDLTALLEQADPAVLVATAVARIEDLVRDAVDALEDALGRLTAGIEAVAAQAEAVLGEAVAGIREFRSVIDEVAFAVENLGILDVAADIADTLGELREDVSTLLTAAPLPDALRGAVEQLIATLESIDLDAAVGGPLREVAAQLQLPDDVAATVRDGLEAIADAVTTLVPGEVIADLETMMGEALAELQHLDVGELTSGIAEMLDAAAGVFEQVRMSEVVAPATDVFGHIVQAVDRVHPRAVLRPAIDAYAQVLGAVPLPDPETAATRVGSVTSQAGESVARAAAEPARRAVGAASPTSSGSTDPAREEPPDDLRPGDIVRLVGFLPSKLREALAGLDAGPAGEVLAAIDGQFTSTAAGLREVRDRLVGLDRSVEAALSAALAPVTAAQVDAQLALSGSAALSAGGIEAEASFDLIASVGPRSLEVEVAGERRLVADRCREVTAGLTGTVADDIDRVAELLDAVLPTALLTDIDALLAALDPEPIAAELDALLVAVVDATPAFLAAAESQLRALEVRVRGLIDTYNPGALMQRYLGVLEVVREELEVLDPARLADELGEVHAQLRAAVTAYDPLVLAGDVDVLLGGVAAAVRGLDPAGLLPDLGGIAVQVARLEGLLPVNALAGVGTQLEDVGTELRGLDVQGMLDAVNTLTPEIAEAISMLIRTVRDEIVRLLESIRFASTNASASVSVGVG